MRKKTVLTALVTIGLFATSLAAMADDAKPESHDVAVGTSPAIVFDAKNKLHVVFEAKDHGNTNNDIFATESSDGGKTWTIPVDVSNTPGVSSQPAIALERNGALDVAWRDTSSDEDAADVYFSRSTDGGRTWTPPVDVSNTPGASSEPSVVAASDGTLHIIWSDTSKGTKNKDIYYSYSKDGGKTWGKDALLPAVDISNTAGSSSEPKLVIDSDDQLHAVWVDSTPGLTRPDVFASTLSQGHWTKPEDLSDNTRISSHPGVACGPNGKFYLVWSDSSKELHLADVWCMIGDEGKFGKQQNVSNTAGVSTQPFITADETGRVAIAWSDTSIEYNRPEVYVRTSHDKCKTLSHITDMSNTQGSSKHVQAAINRDRLYVVWEEDDERPGTHVMVSSVEF